MTTEPTEGELKAQARAKAELLCECSRPGPMARGDLQVVVLEGPRMFGDLLEVVLVVAMAGEPVMSDTFRFQNPPVGDVGMTHAEILETIILDAVESEARRLGVID